MIKLLFFHFQITKLKLKMVKLLFFSLSSYLLEVKNILLLVTNSFVKLSFFHFRVTNSNLSNCIIFENIYVLHTWKHFVSTSAAKVHAQDIHQKIFKSLEGKIQLEKTRPMTMTLLQPSISILNSDC